MNEKLIQTKRFKPDFVELPANGKIYRQNRVLSIERYEQYQMLEPRLAFDIDFNNMYKQLRQLYQNLDNKKFADSAVICYNLMSGIKDLLDNKRESPALLMACLAILAPGEDPKSFDEEVQKIKIADWRAEGYAMEDFFTFVAIITNGLPKAYNEYIQENEINEATLKITK